MIPEEHMLLITMFMKQNQAIKILLDILKSRGVITGDDAEAFQFSQIQDVGSNAALYDQMLANYLKIAKSLDLHTGLENLPPPSLDWFQPPKT